jgi:hypothetical protein
VNKKKQKNFDPLSFGRPGLAARVTDQETTSIQSFFASFCSQKEEFLSFSETPDTL